MPVACTLTEQYYSDGYQDHEHVVVAQEGYQPCSALALTSSPTGESNQTHVACSLRTACSPWCASSLPVSPPLECCPISCALNGPERVAGGMHSVVDPLSRRRNVCRARGMYVCMYVCVVVRVGISVWSSLLRPPTVRTISQSCQKNGGGG